MVKMLYTDELIEEIRLNNDIVDVVSEYVKLDKKGKDYFGLCPFHKEKTPSFSVAPHKQIFYCFGCGKGGNVIQFVMNVENLDYVEAIKLLADRAKIQLPEDDGRKELEKSRLRQEILAINLEAAKYFYENLISANGEAARRYLASRGIKEQTIRKFGLGYSSAQWDGLYKHLSMKSFKDDLILTSGLALKGRKGGLYDRFRNRIMFPIFDIRGNVIAFGGRVTDSSLPKYMNSPETPVYSKGKSLYALNFAKNSGEKRLLVVEGYMDVISLHQNGIINTVASLGTALTESQGRLLKKYSEEIIISYDADTAGQAAALRGLDLLNDIGCNVRVLVVPQGKDPDEYIRNNGADGFRRIMDSSLSLIEYKIKRLKEQIDISTTEGKIVFLNRIAAVLSKVDNSMEREMYAKKLSKEYEISEESLLTEIYKKIKPRNGLKKKTEMVAAKVNESTSSGQDDSRLIHDERFILSLLCLDNGLFGIAAEHLKKMEFTGDCNKNIANTIFSRLREKKGICPAELMNIIDSDAVAEFSKIINEECHSEDNKKALLSKIKSIELYKAEKRQKEVIGLLKKEDLKEGDVEKLKQELRALLIEIKKLKAG